MQRDVDSRQEQLGGDLRLLVTDAVARQDDEGRALDGALLGESEQRAAAADLDVIGVRADAQQAKWGIPFEGQRSHHGRLTNACGAHTCQGGLP